MHEVFELQTHCSTFAVQVTSPVFQWFCFYIPPPAPAPALLLRVLCVAFPVCFGPLSLSQSQPPSPPSSFPLPSQRYL
jgi:hypothetical protein